MHNNNPKSPGADFFNNFCFCWHRSDFLLFLLLYFYVRKEKRSAVSFWSVQRCVAEQNYFARSWRAICGCGLLKPKIWSWLGSLVLEIITIERWKVTSEFEGWCWTEVFERDTFIFFFLSPELGHLNKQSTSAGERGDSSKILGQFPSKCSPYGLTQGSAFSQLLCQVSPH